jgi:hypothetical protein
MLASGPTWKVKNFGTAGMPMPYRDPHGVPLDYVGGTTMTPTVQDLRDGYDDLINKGKRKKDEETGEPVRPYDPDKQVARWLADAIHRHRLKNSDLATPLVKEIARQRPVQPIRGEGRWGADQANGLINLLKAGQSRLWNDPQLALAFKALVATAAYQHRQEFPESSQAQESMWGSALHAMGAKDTDPTGTMLARHLMTKEGLRATWDLLGTLAQERSRSAFRGPEQARPTSTISCVR